MLGACGGGSGGSSASSFVAGSGAPPPVTASSSASIFAAAGGSVSTVLNGDTVTLTVPAAALSKAATVTLTVYAQAGLPRQFASDERKPQALPSGAKFIIGMNVAIGGTATLLKPLSFSVDGVARLPAGRVVRLAASLQSGFNDVDTATDVNGTITESDDPAYAGVSFASPSTVFAFYDMPAASAPPPPTVSLTVAGPTSVVGANTATFTATETDANGFPVLDPTIVYSLNSTALGTINATTGVLTASTANNLSGQVIGTDKRNASITGSLAITVLSSRPATTGDTIAYAGTFASSIANNAISSDPVVSSQSGPVTQTVTVSSASPGQAVLSTTESDNFALATLTTKTTSTLAYQTAAASTQIRLVSSNATDSNNVIYSTQYTPTSGLLTVEPEVAGSFGPNDASQTYSETDPGVSVGANGQNTTTTRVTESNGTYTETTTNADASTNQAVERSDGSGSYTLGDCCQFTFGAPIGSAQTGYIPISYGVPQNGSYVVSQNFQTSIWYPLPLVESTEFDNIAAVTAYDSRCTVPAKYGTTSSQVTQAITSIDAIYGNVERQTSTAYDVAGVGTVCSIFTDTTQTYYDYTGQEPYTLFSGQQAEPVLVSTVTEVLSITSGSVSGQPASTDAHARSSLAIGRLAIVAGRERFRHAVQEIHRAQARRMAQMMRERQKGVH